VPEALAKLRRELEGELEGLARKRSVGTEVEALDKDIESTHRQLELLEVTEEQLAAQGLLGQPAIEAGASGRARR
jgi:hypothetical protein